MKLTLLLSFLTIFISGCTANISGTEEKGELPRELTNAEKKLVKTSQSFSYNLFRETVSSEKEENIFISPLSVSMALGMTMNGAKGKTYDEMRETLAFHDLDIDEINEGYKSLMELLTTIDPKVKMEIANSVWSREGFPVLEQFSSTLEEYFNANSTELDFSDPNSKDVINGWVNDNTNGLIDEILKTPIPDYMIMYLINAIYFKGDWAYQFDEEETRESPFKLENKDQVMVDMMNQKNNFATYFSDNVQMIDLPYGDSLYSMSIIMPENSETPIDEFVESEFSKENFSSWVENLTVDETQLRMPKFEMEYEVKMNDILKSIGMEQAFIENRADFSGISGNGRLFISEVIHKTFVTVDEVGTEAAAVTSVGLGTTSVPEIRTMIVNSPFIFVIREQNSDTILFMGKIKNPTS
ncbi:MAG: serpin family protein [Balneolaceae bacterium]